MSGIFGQIGGAKERGPGYEYLGIGKYVLEIVEIKAAESFIVEVKVLEAHPYRDKAPTTAVGSQVSWMVSLGGSAKKREMGLADAKGFMVALVTSLGQDPAHISNAAWEGIGAKVCGKEQMARGVQVGALLWRDINKETGEEYHIPKARFSAIPGQAPRPGIFAVYGGPAPVTTTAQTAPAAAPGPLSEEKRVELMDKLKTAMNAAKSKGASLGALMDSGAELYQRAQRAGITPSDYNKALEQVYDDIPF